MQNQDRNKYGDLFNYKKNIVTNEQSPQLYSKQVIGLFSIMFSVFFGGILLALNLRTLNNKVGMVPVLAYSVVYTFLMIYGLSQMNGSTTGLTIALNGLGAFILNSFFWNRFIGDELEYRTKPYWVPLVIGIAITGLILWAAIAGM